MVAQSFMRNAVTASTPASAAYGTLPIAPESTKTQAMRNSDWNTAVSRVLPPLLTATLVRAIAAVEGTPPKNGITMLPMPCATSSTSEANGSFFLAAAQVPQSRLSTMPSSAIVTAATSPSISGVTAENSSFTVLTREDGICPIVRTPGFQKTPTSVTTMIAARLPGMNFAAFFG